MSDLKYIITVLTVSFIIYGLILVFTPVGNMGNFFKTFVGVSLVAVIVLTVSRQGIDLKLEAVKAAESVQPDSSAIYSFTAEHSEEGLESYICELLKQNGCEFENLRVRANISSDGGISIDRVEISCDKQQSAEIKRIINSLSLHCVITESEK